MRLPISFLRYFV